MKVANSKYSYYDANGQLILSHPTYFSEENKSFSISGRILSDWLEGVYRCQVESASFGKILTRQTQVRLADLLYEPGALTANQVLGSSDLATNQFQDLPPKLGGGHYLPGEVVVLRCPIIAVSAETPSYRWFYLPPAGDIMQPVEVLSSRDDEVSSPRFKAFSLENGRWLEIHLGRIDPKWLHDYWIFQKYRWNLERSERVIQAKFDNTSIGRVLTTAGFGEYVCNANLPESWIGVAGEGAGSLLNLTGPYIPVYLAKHRGDPAQSNLSKINVLWSVSPDMLALVDLPPPPTGHLHAEDPTGNEHLRIWRKVGQSVTLLCAANLRLTAGADGTQKDSQDSSVSRSFGLVQTGMWTNVSGGWSNFSEMPQYSIRWLKDNYTLEELRRAKERENLPTVVGSASLRLTGLRTWHSGLYRCQVIAMATTTTVIGETSVTLLVGAAPWFAPPTVPNPLVGHVQTLKILSCKAFGTPKIYMEWRKNGEPVRNSQFFRIETRRLVGDEITDGVDQSSGLVSTLTIQSLLASDEGYYQCFAYNRFGSSQHIIVLHVNESPEDQSDSAYSTGDYLETKTNAPENVKVVSLTDTLAYITWSPPTHYGKRFGEDRTQLVYRVRIQSHYGTRPLTINTTDTNILLTDLKPNSMYEVTVSTVRSDKDFEALAATTASVRFVTKPFVYRPPAVTDLSAESKEFGALNISWTFQPTDEKQASSMNRITHFRIVLYNLNPSNGLLADRQASSVSPRRQAHTVEVSAKTSAPDSRDHHRLHQHHVVRKLSADSFYQISVQAVTSDNVTGHPAVISSSPRVISRPPMEAPSRVTVHSMGAHVATITWNPPKTEGEVILYRLNISCEDWLFPKQVDVIKDITATLTGLNSATRYDLTVSAATRGGRGPVSPQLTFTTMRSEGSADRNSREMTKVYDMSSSDVASPYEESHIPKLGRDDSEVPAASSLQVTPEERGLLILWSPIQGSASEEVVQYTVRWGTLYPGPSQKNLPGNQTRFLIQDLDVDTPYLIEVSSLHPNGLVSRQMASGRTKAASFYNHLMIPVNLHLSSVAPDWAIVVWDVPQCSKQQPSQNSPLPLECRHGEQHRLVKSYQVVYNQQEDLGEAGLANEATGEPGYRFINVSRTWVKLEQLVPGRAYSVAVRALGRYLNGASTGGENQYLGQETIFSEWSMEQTFSTPDLKPGDPPSELSATEVEVTDPGTRKPRDSVSLQLSWQPPLRPHGRLIGYTLYLAVNRTGSKPGRVATLNLPADSLNTVLSDLSTGTVYSMRISASNRLGEGPLSKELVYRTSNAFDQTGERYQVNREGWGDSQILPSELSSEASLDGKRTQKSDGTDNRKSIREDSQFVLITVLSFTLLVAVGAAILVLWHRLQRRRNLRSSGHFKFTRVTGSAKTRENARRQRMPLKDMSLLVANDGVVTRDEEERLVRGASEQLTKSLRLTPTTTGPLIMVGDAGLTGLPLIGQPQMPRHQTPTHDPVSSSWDQESDLLQFASPNRQMDNVCNTRKGQPACSPTRNIGTPTPANSSTNSPAGSLGSPGLGMTVSRQTAASHTYELYRQGNAYALNMYPHAGQTYPTVAYRDTTEGQFHHLSGRYEAENNGMVEMHHAPQFVYPAHLGVPVAAVYPVGNMFVQGHVPRGYNVTATASVNPMIPRVNASDLVSFTSSDCETLPNDSMKLHRPRTSNGEGELKGMTLKSNTCDESTGKTRRSNRSTLITSPRHKPPTSSTVASTDTTLSAVSDRDNGRLRSTKRRPSLPAVTVTSLGETVATVRSGGSESRTMVAENRDTADQPVAAEQAVTEAARQTSAFSSEELSQEMANLEGLMKDLNAITQDEFNHKE